MAAPPHEKNAEQLADRLHAWRNTADPLDGGWPTMPDGVEDRDADVWEALLAVADLAGGHWPRTRRVAAVTLVTAARQRPPSLGVLLLRDIKKVFDDHRDTEKLLNEDIIRGLIKIDESPWASIRRGEPIDPRSLASRLRKYGISSKPRRAGEDVFKGYSRAQFEDAWSRYIEDDSDDSPPVEGDLSVTPVTDDTGDPCVTDVTDLFGGTGHDDIYSARQKIIDQRIAEMYDQ